MSYTDIIARFQAQQAAARRANELRYAQALKLYDQIIKQYETGGGFGAGWEAQLGRQKVKDIAAGQQSLVSGGLFGTTITAGLPKKWEEEVGTPARLKLEDIRMERLSQALQAKAGLIERREDIGPDYATIAALAAKAAAAPQIAYGQATPQFAGGYGAGSPFGGTPASTGGSTVNPRGTRSTGSYSSTLVAGTPPAWESSVEAYKKIPKPPKPKPSPYQYAPFTPSQQIEYQFTPEPLRTYEPKWYA